MKSILLPALCGFLLLAASPARASFVLIDDFQTGYTAGPVNGQNGWSGAASIADLDGNFVLATPATASITFTHKDVSGISNTDTGTLFYTFSFVSDTLEMGSQHGLSDSTNPTAYGNYKTQVANTGTSGFAGRDAGSTPTLYAASGEAVFLDANTTYSLWMVADNANDTYSLYLQGGDYTSQTALAIDSAYTDFTLDFRGPTTSPLQSIFVSTSPASDQSVFLDNFYLDATSANLGNPIPEPHTAALLGLAAGCLAWRRRTGRAV